MFLVCSLGKLPRAADFTGWCSALSASSALHQGKTILPLISSALFGSLFFFSALCSVSRRLGGGTETSSFLHHSTMGAMAKALRFSQRLRVSAGEK